MPSRLPSPPSSSSSNSLSLHHCSLCSDVSESIPTEYDASFSYPYSNFDDKRLNALQDQVSKGNSDPAQMTAILSPGIVLDQACISLATHVARMYLPRSPYLGSVSTYVLQEAIRVWDQGYAEMKTAKALKEGRLSPPSSGGCWPARVAASDEGNATVFIGGLAAEVTEWYLAAIFTVFGPYTGVSSVGTLHRGLCFNGS